MKESIELVQYGPKEFRAWLHEQPCATCGAQGIAIHQSHMISKRPKGRGSWRDSIPQCWVCHEEFHRIGRKTFCTNRGMAHDWLLALTEECQAAFSEASEPSASTRRILVEGGPDD